jgi:uncharacterized protein YjcR
MKRPPEIWQQIKTAYATGSVGLRELARNMGIPAGTILARSKREGWSKQVKDAKALAKRDDRHREHNASQCDAYFCIPKSSLERLACRR